MPHSFEKKGQRKYIPADKDRRVKLTAAERAEIAANVDGLSQRALAAKYGVSRRLVTFLLDPTKREENLKRREERGGSAAYYDTEEWREAMKRHRQYKKALDETGVLLDTPSPEIKPSGKKRHR